MKGKHGHKESKKEEKKEERKKEHEKRARGGHMGHVDEEGAGPEEKRRGGHVHGKHAKHRADKRARGGKVEKAPYSEAGKMKKTSYESAGEGGEERD